MTLEEALQGKEIPAEIKSTLCIVDIPYFSFESSAQIGQLVVHERVAEEVRIIFQKLFAMQFPIKQIIPVIAYDWDDDASMAANNTSAFNYRMIFGKNELSNHSYGLAIDINPLQNPYVRRDGVTVPPGAEYDLAQPGTITNEAALIFKSLGWGWGGNWIERKDWQHFEKL
jgi:hypothetical protein